MNYYILTADHDSEAICFSRPLSKSTLIAELAQMENDYAANGFLSTIPDSAATENDWPRNKLLILKAKVVVPLPKKVVTEWTVDE